MFFPPFILSIPYLIPVYSNPSLFMHKRPGHSYIGKKEVMRSEKYLLDIQRMYDASPLNGAQNATLIELAKQQGGGTLKSVPYQPSTFIMFYNKDAFTKAGITAVPTTWDEFLADCEALKGAGVIPMTVDDAYMACLFGFLMYRVAGSDTTEAVAAGIQMITAE